MPLLAMTIALLFQDPVGDFYSSIINGLLRKEGEKCLKKSI
jgi:hypothetical protein